MSDTTLIPITAGMSGAEVFSIGGTQILKTVRFGNTNDPSLFRREAAFYRFAGTHGFPFIPEILSIEETSDQLSILMKQYRPVSQSEADNTFLPRLARTLAEIHTAPIPDFLPEPEQTPLVLNKTDMRNCTDGWLSILDEHPTLTWNGLPAEEILHHIAVDINELNRRTFQAHFTLNHGDFHLGN